ncbi:acid phosphatase [Multifurca ochricompacta]|uniref:Phytase A n=1 Tax=Multifurca ochricompacta TaxID=376703 RepID=A0AAD4M9R9_9AGAM|nr:acid phosphatase [Multifurca ochricompacta]
MAKEVVTERPDLVDHSSRWSIDEVSRTRNRTQHSCCIPHWQIFVLAPLLWLLWSKITPHQRPTLLLSEASTTVPVDHVPNIGFPESVLRTWAQYAPYIPTADYVPPPSRCAISQVNVLQRHGARWPTSSAGTKYKVAVDKLQNIKDYKEDYLTFLRNFTWNFGADDMLPFGAKQSYEAGVVAFNRYAHIVTEDSPPFVRAASSQRVIDSAANWTAGFNSAGHTIKARVDLVLPESGNLTLDDNMCPNSGKGNAESGKWLAIFAPSITKRLNLAAPGADLTDEDTHNLMSLCAFHSQVTMAPSPFCGLFTWEDFKGYEYFGDLDKFYGNGYGGNLGRVQGVGYVNELLARLRRQPIRDNTQTNRTLDSSPETFPLDRALYADFSHDNAMVAIFAALGLFRQHRLPGRKLDPVNPSPRRTWYLSSMVPFSGRMVVEKLECTGSDLLATGPFVRILINDAVQPLEFCGGISGLCQLNAFVESQWYARQDGDGDFEKCFE